MIQAELLVQTPAARATDPLGSSDAERRINSSGKRAHDQRIVLRLFLKYPGFTTKEVAGLENLDRYMLARRAPELAPWLLDRIEAPPGTPRDKRELRWRTNERGRHILETLMKD